jgi:hypothetical protein
MLLREAADVYLGRHLFTPRSPKVIAMKYDTGKTGKYDSCGVGISQKSRFGGDVPSDADKQNHVSCWDGIPVQDWSNFACAVIQPGYGPNSIVVAEDHDEYSKWLSYP